jgi:hypothetical protein
VNSVSDPSHPRPTGANLRVSAHAAEQYQHRVKPALDLDAARAELEQLADLAQITSQEPGWLHAADPAPFYLLISNALALPLQPQDGGWIATTCVAAGAYTPVRRAQRAASKSSRAAAKRAKRRARH